MCIKLLTSINGILECLYFSLLLHQDYLGLGIIDGDTSRVIATVFQALEPGHQEFQNLLATLRRQVVQIRKDS